MSRTRRKKWRKHEKDRGLHQVTRDNPAVPCPQCGIRVATSRLREHFREPECLVGETLLVMADKGYEPLISGSGGRASVTLRDVMAILGCAETDLPEAPVRVVRGPWTGKPSGTREIVRGRYAPRPVLRAARMLEGLDLPPGLRRATAHRVYTDPEFADALRSAKDLGGRAGARVLAAEAFGAAQGSRA